MADRGQYGVLLVTGGASHQENYGPGFQADPRCRIIGVADEAQADGRRKLLNRSLAEEMKVPLLPDLDASLRRRDVQIVSICTEHERQGRVAVRCAEAGKHLYIDKPIAGDLAEARKAASIVQQKRLRSQMFTTLNLPYAQRAMRIVRSGWLGEVRAIHCDLMFAKGHTGSAPLGKARKESYPPRRFLFPDAKREMFNIAVYSLALIRWLTGRREVRSVRAVTGNYFFNENVQRDFEDFGALAVRLDGGLTATIMCGRIGWMSHLSGGHNVVRLSGTRRNVAIDASQPRVEVASDRPPWQIPPRDPDDPMGFWRSTQQKAGIRPRPEWYVPELLPVRSDQSLFIDCVEQDREAECTIADGVAVLEVLMAAYKSAATGKVANLPLSA